MDKQPKQLPLPPGVQSDPSAVEIARVWVGNGRQHISLASGAWEDPAAWGTMLADFGKLVADSYKQTKGLDYADSIKRIKAAFDLGWNEATDRPAGRILE